MSVPPEDMFPHFFNAFYVPDSDSVSTRPNFKVAAKKAHGEIATKVAYILPVHCSSWKSIVEYRVLQASSYAAVFHQ